jgi:hypothetical protein
MGLAARRCSAVDDQDDGRVALASNAVLLDGGELPGAG